MARTLAERRPARGARYPRSVIDPASDPIPDPSDALATPSLRHNSAFVRVWSAAAISVFGSFVTRIALPFVAILTLNAGPLEVALLRAVELVAALLVGFVAGAWVDRLRRRPVLIWADLVRAALLGSIPLAAAGGWLTLPQVYLVAILSAVCTTFFDLADRAYLPTIVPRAELVRANSALSATSAAVEFAGFGAAGVLVALLTAPIAILIDAVTFVVSAVILGTIRVPEGPPPREGRPRAGADRDRRGTAGRRRRSDPPGLTAGTMGLSAMWGVVGASWLLYATDDLGLEPAVIGVVAALGGFGSLLGALVAGRISGRLGVGRAVMGSLVLAALATMLIPLAPAGAPFIAVAFLLAQQLIGDSAITVFDVTEVSVRQARVPGRQLGRVNGTIHTAAVVAQLAGTLLGGMVAAVFGLRVALVLGPIGVVLGLIAVWMSPVRRQRSVDQVADGDRVGGLASSVEQRLDERLRVEREQVLGLLPHPDEPHRDAELVLDREHDAALRRRVELGEHDAGQAHRLVERLGLDEAVLAGRRVEDEERLDHGAREPLVDHPADLRQLVHEVRLRVEAARPCPR